MTVSRPRRRLPARVYWFRRIMVLAIACGLVFGISRLLSGGSDAPPKPSARPAAAVGSTTGSPSAVSSAAAVATAGAAPSSQPTAPRKTPTQEPLAIPTGPCLDSDVRVKPAMQGNAYAGGDVRLTLELSTTESPACNWQVSADTLAVKLTSGSDRIWSTQDCRPAVPNQTVVLRSRQGTLLDVTWSGRRSDADCSRNTQWAEPGYYHVEAAAMGADPESEQFYLQPPAPVTITPTPSPDTKGKAKKAGH
ncbi:MAG TPA: hypothetical protein VK204_16965 [Nocardioidaceae bacterium]|nr:hypothetical protein [Nocardioidaceae bacterium]